MNAPSTQQIEMAEKLGIQKLILPTMSRFEVKKIIDTEVANRAIIESKEALHNLLQRGLQCGCEVEQKMHSDTRWGLVYKIDKTRGMLGVYIRQNCAVKVDAKQILARTFERQEGMTFVPFHVLKAVMKGKYGERFKSAIHTEIMPKSNIKASFLPDSLVKELKRLIKS